MYAIVAPLCTCRPVVYNVVLNVEDLFSFPYQQLGNKSSKGLTQSVIVYTITERNGLPQKERVQFNVN